jgi:hypothetical protein
MFAFQVHNLQRYTEGPESPVGAKHVGVGAAAAFGARRPTSAGVARVYGGGGAGVDVAGESWGMKSWGMMRPASAGPGITRSQPALAFSIQGMHFRSS